MKIYNVAIIGSGFSGITCAHYLKEEGIDNCCSLEKNTDLGVDDGHQDDWIKCS